MANLRKATVASAFAWILWGNASERLESVASEGRLRDAGAQEPECTRQYMGIPWPAKRYINVPGLILAPPARKLTSALAFKSLLVAEMPNPGKHHRQIVFVGRGDHFLVAHRTARLDYRAHASLCCGIDAVAEREERVGCHHAAGD